MMIGCFPPCSHCRPRFEEEHIERFLVHYNAYHNSSYYIERLLDVENRNDRQPEALLRSPGLIDVVIENKIVVWPPTHFMTHRNHHFLSRHFLDRIRIQGNPFVGAAYQLRVQDSHLSRVRQTEIQRIAYTIADSVLLHASEVRASDGIRYSEPIPWSFRQMSSYELEDSDPTEGISVSVVSEGADLMQHMQALRAGNTAEFERLAFDASRKFANYHSHWKLFLVQFAEEMMAHEEENEIVRSAQIPDLIDEVWLETDEWITDADYESVFSPIPKSIDTPAPAECA